MESPRSNCPSPTQVDFHIEYTEGMNPPPPLVNENFNVAIHNNSIAAQYHQGPAIAPNTLIATDNAITALSYEDANWASKREPVSYETADKVDQQASVNLYCRGNADGGYHSLNIYNHLPNAARDIRAYLDYDGSAGVTHEVHRPKFDIHPPTPHIKFRDLLEYSVKEVEAAGFAIDSLGYNFNNDIKNIFQDLASRLERNNSQWLTQENASKDVHALERELLELRGVVDNQVKGAVAKERVIENLTSTLSKEKQKSEAIWHSGEQKLNEHMSKYETHVADTLYQRRLLQRVFHAMKTQMEASNRSRWEVACMKRAEDLCSQMKDNFRTHTAELEAKVEQLEREKVMLTNDKDEYETAVQQALMRGLCSLNLETLKVLKVNHIGNNGAQSEMREGAREAEPTSRPPAETIPMSEDAPSRPRDQELRTVQDSRPEAVIHRSAGQLNPNRFGQRCNIPRHTSNRPVKVLQSSATVTKIPRKPAVTSTKRKV